MEEETAAAAAQVPKKRTFKKYSYRGVDLEQLLDKSNKDLMELFPARARRKLSRGMKQAAAMEKPEVVKTHLRDMIILPEMVGSVVGVYNGKVFNQVEIKPEMIGHYLGEFSVTYKPVKHGRPGIGATHSSRFIPLK
ncbi:ribosomal protein S15 [Dermatophagoides pteronyssinus]|uniref:40S ribosomal protein S15 n=1 Tax=Dermatophagoides pteronyssinus TaxID=6956 RepID=A0ABQ8J4S6_DERPT|nr:ribosomal protein S15 [Dermatophagoides pteronyssinus]